MTTEEMTTTKPDFETLLAKIRDCGDNIAGKSGLYTRLPEVVEHVPPGTLECRLNCFKEVFKFDDESKFFKTRQTKPDKVVYAYEARPEGGYVAYPLGLDLLAIMECEQYKREDLVDDWKQRLVREYYLLEFKTEGDGLVRRTVFRQTPPPKEKKVIVRETAKKIKISDASTVRKSKDNSKETESKEETDDDEETDYDDDDVMRDMRARCNSAQYVARPNYVPSDKLSPCWDRLEAGMRIVLTKIEWQKKFFGNAEHDCHEDECSYSRADLLVELRAVATCATSSIYDKLVADFEDEVSDSYLEDKFESASKLIFLLVELFGQSDLAPRRIRGLMEKIRNIKMSEIDSEREYLQTHSILRSCKKRPKKNKRK